MVSITTTTTIITLDQEKKINLQSIDTIPEEPNTISGGKNMGDSTSIQTVLLYTTISGVLFYCFLFMYSLLGFL